MHTNEPLHILQEEAAEVIQAISKIYRFGWDSSNPFVNPEKTNKMHLVEEIGDILAVIDIVQQVYELDEWALIEAKNRKFEKLKKWSTIDVQHLEHPETFDLSEQEVEELYEDFGFEREVEQLDIFDDFNQNGKGTMIETLPEIIYVERPASTRIVKEDFGNKSTDQIINQAQELLDHLNSYNHDNFPTQEQLDSIKPWYKRAYKWIARKF